MTRQPVTVDPGQGPYIDIHTQLYPEGGVRGQLLAQVPEPAGNQPACHGIGADPGWRTALLEVAATQTFLNLCSDRRLSGRGLSGQVCGQFVHDTSPT